MSKETRALLISPIRFDKWRFLAHNPEKSGLGVTFSLDRDKIRKDRR
ncbi:MAG: hypothetical protein ACE5K3_07175 [bacterium]